MAVRRFESGTIGIRNTNDPTATVLVITAEAMADWLDRIKAGTFDDLV